MGPLQEYQFLFDQNPLPMWVFDRASLRFLAVNDAAITHYGCEREQWLALTILDIWPSAEVDVVIDVANSPETLRSPGQVWTQCKQDGTRIPAAIFGRDIAFEGCRARLVLAKDVTERERKDSDSS